MNLFPNCEGDEEDEGNKGNERVLKIMRRLEHYFDSQYSFLNTGYNPNMSCLKNGWTSLSLAFC